jgi:hypothetical protein
MARQKPEMGCTAHQHHIESFEREMGNVRLRNIGCKLRNLAARQPLKRVTDDFDRAFLGRQKSEQGLEQRRLARAIRPE